MKRSSEVDPTVGQPPASPVARRARAPRWLDLRMLIGLALVLTSVVAGARLLSSTDDSVTVWAVTGDLAAGTTLTESDLTTVSVRLDEHASSYLSTATSPVGKTLARDVAKGDLLPAKAIGDTDGVVALALSIPAAQVPVSVSRGDRVSLFATSEPQPGANEQQATTTMVIESATVSDLSDRGQGALSVGNGDLQVVIKVRSCAVPGILDATSGKALTLVEVPASSAPAKASC